MEQETSEKPIDPTTHTSHANVTGFSEAETTIVPRFDHSNDGQSLQATNPLCVGLENLEPILMHISCSVLPYLPYLIHSVA